MANVVAFTFRGIDRFSSVARRIAGSAMDLQNSFRGASRSAELFSNEVETMGRSVSSASGQISRMNQNVSNTSGLENARNGIRGVGDEAQRAGERIRGLGTKFLIGATLPAILLGKSMLQSASDSVETGNKFKVVFGSIEKEAESAATNLAANFGLAGDEAKKLLGDTGDLLTGFGFGQDEALKLSNKVQELAVDLASFTNFSGGAKGASDALTKALLGERESLKSLGVAISEDLVKREISKLRAEGQVFKTLQQAKAQATLSLAFKQSKNALGDFSRSSGEFANQQRILAARTSDLSGELGLIFLPIANKITGVLIDIIEGIRGWSKTTKTVVLVIAATIAIVGPLLLILGGISLILPILTAGFAAVGTAIAFAFSPITLIVLAVAALIAAGFLLKNNWIEVSNVIGGTIEQIGINFDIMVDNFVDKINAIKSKITGFASSVANLGSSFGQSVGDFFSFGGQVETTSNSRTQLDVNLNAPQGAVKSVESSTTGKAKDFNMGLNLITAPG